MTDGLASPYQTFLQTRGLEHGAESLDRFLAEHPAVFGRNHQIVLNGYRAWLRREVLADKAESFARFCAARWARHNGKKTGGLPRG